MANEEDDNLKQFYRSAEQKQHHRVVPKKVGDVLNKLLARKGYARTLTVSAVATAWIAASGEKVAKHTRATEIKRGVLEVLVRNSVVLQEVTLSKQNLLQQMVTALPEQKIRDLKFKIGTIE